MSRGFDVTALLGGQMSKLDPTQESDMRKIPLDQIQENENNEAYGFTLTDIEDLAESIQLVGLIQPCSVVPTGDPDKPYRMEAGHRRLAAYKLLRDSHPETGKWTEIPCVVHTPASGTLEELALILTNLTPRKLTPAQLGELAEKTTELLLKYQEETGVQLPGKMRDRVAELLDTNATKLANLKVIRKGLIPEYMAEFERKEHPLDVSVALELARLPAIFQRMIRGTGRALSAQGVKNYARDLTALKALTCADGSPCANVGAMWEEMNRIGNYRYMPCRGQSAVCCLNCAQRFECRAACPQCADEVKAAKAEKRAIRKQEIAAEKREKAEKAQRTQDIWTRLREARDNAGVSAEAVFTFLGHHKYRHGGEEGIAQRERGEFDFTASTELPYDSVEDLATAAKLLGCSTDFLLRRTDILLPADKVIPTGQMVFNGWMPGGTTPADPCEIVGDFDLGGGVQLRQTARWDGQQFVFRKGGEPIELPPIRWMTLPPVEEGEV